MFNLSRETKYNIASNKYVEKNSVDGHNTFSLFNRIIYTVLPSSML